MRGVGGRLTGHVSGPIVNAARKADLLEQLARTEGIALEQTVAIGDGANDVNMITAAHVGIGIQGLEG